MADRMQVQKAKMENIRKQNSHCNCKKDRGAGPEYNINVIMARQMKIFRWRNK
jgi:hypothetical protein